MAHDRRIPKEYRALVDAARKQGWRVDERKKGKAALILYPPNGTRAIPVHSSPGRGRALANFRSEVKRAGLRL